MKTNTSKMKNIKIDVIELNRFTKRAEKRDLLEEDYDVMIGMAKTIVELSEMISKKNMTIKKLRFMMFGSPTETSKKILDINTLSDDIKPTIKEKKKGHGRNGAIKYTGAQTFFVKHSEIKKGDKCPACLCGRTYPLQQPGIIINLFASSPVQANKYELEKLRCNACGMVFTAKAPSEAGNKKYNETVAAMNALLRYGCGFPFYRLARLQENVGVPLPTSTQWDIIEKFADRIYPVYEELISQAAQGDLIHNDDTTNKILSLSLRKEDSNQSEKPSRTGVFTTGIISKSKEYEIAVYFTSNRHAGENMTNLLVKRCKELDDPIQMCDALSRNQSKKFDVILANCLTHGRRYFVDVFNNFSEQCGFVIELLGKVYKYDAIARENKMLPEERLIYHQAQSGPLMKTLKEWLDKQFDEKLAEPNSGLGKAISYMLKHWQKLTMFLKVPGAPLDNNICERALKKVILHRKNSYFFKTEHGAYIGDLFMSLIHTCSLMKVNAFHYLTTLHKHCSKAFKHSKDWMPWNYTDQLIDSS